MNELLATIGLILALEGAAYALFPYAMKRMAVHILQTELDTLRFAGVVSVALGVALVWAVRG